MHFFFYKMNRAIEIRVMLVENPYSKYQDGRIQFIRFNTLCSLAFSPALIGNPIIPQLERDNSYFGDRVDS